MASRLSDADPELSILVIEGGQNNAQLPSIIHPALVLENLSPDNKRALFYKSNKEKSIADREIVVPAGGILGGGSSINIMMYSRAQRHDFDSWNTLGWSANEMIPYLKKVYPKLPSCSLPMKMAKAHALFSLKRTTARERRILTGPMGRSRYPVVPTALCDARMLSSKP